MLNVKLLPKIKYSTTTAPGHLNSLQGVQGGVSKILQWVKVPLLLPNGHQEQVPFAVINDLPNGMILGRPFLLQIRAVVDHHNNIVITPFGPVSLIIGSSKKMKIAYSTSLDRIEAPLLTSIEKKQLIEILSKFPNLWSHKRKGLTAKTMHKIKLTDIIPVNTKPRRATPEQLKIIAAEIDKMLQDNIIRRSDSPYASELLLVKKKTGDWRVCIDYRELNTKTVPDRYPLPRIADLLKRIQKARYFIALDLRAGYWQIPMDPESIMFTAFRCFKGLFEFLVMPFGLTNAPATFQRFMDTLFGDMYFNGIIVYLDDILIYGATVQETLEKLQIALGRLDAAGLSINLEKCRCFPERLPYLGHIIIGGTMSPDLDKVAILDKITTPKTVHDVRALLGLIGYYQQYIHQYSEVLSPVFDLLKATPNKKHLNKVFKIEWKDLHTNAIKEALQRLRETVLTIPLDSDEFLMETDASLTAVSAVLHCLQHDGSWAPVEFASKKLTPTQQRWDTREREAFAIVFGLHKFEHYLRGRFFTVHTDHQSLQWMLKATKGKIARWASRMSEFNMIIKHKKGKELAHVDFFTRFTEEDPDPDLKPRMVYAIESTTELPSIDEVLAAQKETDMPEGKGYFFRDGIWYFRNGIWVPPQLRQKIMAACHNLAPFRHPGVKRTKGLVARVFSWPNLHADITSYIRSCLICQQSRPGLDRLQGLFRAHPVPAPFQTVYLDYWSCEYQGPKMVLTMIDPFTKWAECIPIPNKSAKVVSSAFIRAWICRFGVPKTIITDNDKTFLSCLFRGIANRLGTTTLRTTPYHPEGNAFIEAFHKVLRKGLMHFIATGNHNIPFEEALQLVLFNYRSLPHSTTNESPAFLTYGTDMRSPLDNDWRLVPDLDEGQRIKFLNKMRLDIQFQTIQQVERRNQTINKDRIAKKFELGEVILTRNTPYELARLSHNIGGQKLIPRWSMPHRVIQVLADGRKAIVRDILAGRVKEIHIQDARFIGLPQDDKQRQEWEAVLATHMELPEEENARTQLIKSFWDAVEYPQTEELKGIKKRRRGV